MKRVALDPRAEAEFLEIVDYLSSFSPDAALRFVDTYWSVIEQLREFPELGQLIRGSITKRVLRRGVYRFVYEVGDRDTLLLRILDGRGQRELP